MTNKSEILTTTKITAKLFIIRNPCPSTEYNFFTKKYCRCTLYTLPNWNQWLCSIHDSFTKQTSTSACTSDIEMMLMR